METNTIDEAKVAQLPQEGVHCFAANSKQINMRRIITIPLIIAFVVLAVFFFVGSYKSILFACLSILCFIISVLVFVHTFLIAKYRIAVDYNQKKIVLRYRYSLITIPFETFDAREGEPDKAEELLENSALGGNEKIYYLVLDNVLDDACYQTTTKDLASREDFFKLKDEVFAIADAYGARNLENAIKPEYGKKKLEKTELGGEEDIKNIVENVMGEAEAEKAAKRSGVSETAEEVKDAVEEKADVAEEAVAEKAEDIKEAVEEKAEDIKEDIKGE